MAKLIVEAEGRRFTIRYSRRETIIQLLEQNADVIEEINLTAPAPEEEEAAIVSAEEEEPNEAEPTGDEPLNNGEATKAAKALLADNNLELENVPADGGRVGVDHVRDYIAG